MPKLRPLIVVTGTLRVEGGQTHKAKQSSETKPGGREKLTIVQDRELTPDRRAGNSKSTTCTHRLKTMSILRTPYGLLVDIERLTELRGYLHEIGLEVAEFNAKSKSSKLMNCVLWEPLSGNRLAAVEGWIERQAREGKTLPAALFAT